MKSRSSAHSSGWQTHTLRPCDCASRSTPTHRSPLAHSICHQRLTDPCPVLPHHTSSSALPTATNTLSPPHTRLRARTSTKPRAARAHSPTARRQNRTAPAATAEQNGAAVAAHPPRRSKLRPWKAVCRQAARPCPPARSPQTAGAPARTAPPGGARGAPKDKEASGTPHRATQHVNCSRANSTLTSP